MFINVYCCKGMPMDHKHIPQQACENTKGPKAGPSIKCTGTFVIGNGTVLEWYGVPVTGDPPIFRRQMGLRF